MTIEHIRGTRPWHFVLLFPVLWNLGSKEHSPACLPDWPFSSGIKAPCGDSPAQVQTINPAARIPPPQPKCGIWSAFIEREKNLLKKKKKETWRKGGIPQFWSWVSCGGCVTKLFISWGITKFFFQNAFIQLRSCFFTALGFPAVNWWVIFVSSPPLQNGFPVCLFFDALSILPFLLSQEGSLINSEFVITPTMTKTFFFFFTFVLLGRNCCLEQSLVKAYSNSFRGVHFHETNTLITKKKSLSSQYFFRTLSGSTFLAWVTVWICK